METILLAIDENSKYYREYTPEFLKHGIYTIRVSSMQEGIEYLENKEVTIVGINADCINFLPLLNVLRIKTNAPIHIMASSPNFDEDIKARDLGADHYGKWNDNPIEGTIRGFLMLQRFIERNRMPKKNCKCIYYHGILLMPEYRKIYVNDNDIDLTRKEFDLLALLMSDTKRVFAYDTIYKNVWKEDYIEVDKGALWNLVKRLRDKIKTNSNMPELIKNVHDIGYAFEH